MNSHISDSLNANARNRMHLAAVVCGLLLLSPGCGIPGLRCAQPGSPLPQRYNWNNGVPFGDQASVAEDIKRVSLDPRETGAAEPFTHSEDDATEPVGSSGESTQLASDVSEANDRQSFSGLIKAASFLKLNRADQADDQPPSSNHEIEILNEGIETPGEQNGASTTYSNELPPYSAEGSAGPDIEIVHVDPTRTKVENAAQFPRHAFFSDPFLADLINQTLAGNQELKILTEEIQIARNEAYARSGEYRPFVTLGAGAEIEKSGRYTREGAVEEQLEVAPGRDFPDPLPDFLVAADVSWELDIWRRLRNAQNAAAMRYLGTRDGRNYMVTRVVAEVAENYYELLALDNRLLTLNKTIEIQQQSLKIAQAKKDAGRGTELAVQRFQAEVRKNQSEQSIIQQEIVEAENRINFLAGRYPQPVERLSAEYIELNLPALSAGVPSQLLRNRADIRQSEREVAAAGLDVQVARARFYPSLTLTGGLGWNAFSTGYLFQTPESLIYSVAGELVGPLINKRAIQAAYRSANAAQLQSIYDYQRTILNAHIEVVNAISKVENYRQSIEVKKQQLASLEASVDSATQLFQNARAEYVEVLLAQRELMEARMLLIDTKQQQLAAIINAYQALGGGGF